MKAPRTVGILIFDEVEELDFVGPFEVFGMAEKIRAGSFRPLTIGVDRGAVKGVNGLVVMPDHEIDTAPPLDILVVPGGRGTRREMANPKVLKFVSRAFDECELVTSVCTGALVLASAGLLDGKEATTHWAALGELRQFDKVRVRHARHIRQGKVITSAGVSSGINMALYVVGLLHGPKLKMETAKQIEFSLR